MRLASLPISDQTFEGIAVPSLTPAPGVEGAAVRLTPRPPGVFDIIDLAQAHRVAAGSERDVYEHPRNPALLIKVINHARAREPGRRQAWHKQFQREQAYRIFIAELSEYLATSAHSGMPQGNALLSRICGVVNTSAGLGLVVEKIVDERGELAPTLQQVVAAQGYGPQLRQQVHQFFLALADAHVIFNDVSARNIVVGRNADGHAGLFLVDGYGPKQFLPVYAWSKALNRRRLLRKYEKMADKMARLGAGALTAHPVEAEPSVSAAGPVRALPAGGRQ
ncbi:YrbL family protein [Achromobacter sp. Marseille-Q4962]|uniref:YrbL family protein n=1 Tax=Achromobacter sp. Marseille-Q4962 TaxID=2942202 RepID=UPI002072B37F|nr:YrbL family protein [Achromobacter sp. Marseille-Q4962]